MPKASQSCSRSVERSDTTEAAAHGTNGGRRLSGERLESEEMDHPEGRGSHMAANHSVGAIFNHTLAHIHRTRFHILLSIAGTRVIRRVHRLVRPLVPILLERLRLA